MSDWLILRDLEVDSEVNFEVNLEVDFKGNIQHLTSSILWADGILPIYVCRTLVIVNELYFFWTFIRTYSKYITNLPLEIFHWDC